MTETYDQPLAELHAGKIKYEEFFRKVGSEERFKKWCADHYLTPDEGAAQCYFDYYGFEESIEVKEFMEPLS